MPTEVTCPHCDWPKEIDPDRVGSEVTCWNCERAFVLLAPGGPDDPPLLLIAEEGEPAAARPRWAVLPWAVAAAAVAVVGVTGPLAWVNARRAADAEWAAAQARAELAAVEYEAAAARESAQQQVIVERDRAKAAEAATRVAPAEPETSAPPPEPAAPAADIPADVRATAVATLRKVGERVHPLFRRALGENRDLLPRLKAGRVVERDGTLVPTDPRKPVEFSSQWSKGAAVKACEGRIAAAERALKAWDGNDLDYFAPDLTGPVARGAVGRVIGREVRVVKVLDPRSAVVRFLTDNPAEVRGREPAGATAVVTGLDAGKLTAGQTADFTDVVVVAGTVAVGGDTYPRLAVFTARP